MIFAYYQLIRYQIFYSPKRCQIILSTIMRKYTMFGGAALLTIVNFYGLLASLIVQPVTPAVIVSSLVVIILTLYVELNKKRVLLRTCIK